MPNTCSCSRLTLVVPTASAITIFGLLASAGRGASTYEAFAEFGACMSERDGSCSMIGEQTDCRNFGGLNSTMNLRYS